jgi:hypothetical protein
MSERDEQVVAEFDSVEYITEGGPDLGLGLHERETRLRVDLKTRVAFLNCHQPTADKGGEALGTFRATLATDLATRLQGSLVKADLGQTAPGAGGAPWTSVIQIRARRGSNTRAESFSSQDMEKLAKFEELLSVLDDATFVTSQHPFQAIRLEMEAKHAGSGFTFSVRVKNVGVETVAIPDLETLGRESKDVREHGIGVRIATLPPARAGFTDPPLLWSAIGLVAASGPSKQAGKPVLLPPGGEQVVNTALWSASNHTGRIFAQGFLSYYRGPAVVDGHLVIRGHALSQAVDIAHQPG